MKTLLPRIRTFLEVHDSQIGKLSLVLSGLALVASFLELSELPFDLAWISVVLCGIPIVKGAIVALVTRFDIKADVLVSIALVASIAIGEDFAAGEVAFIMQLGAFLEETTVKKARGESKSSCASRPKRPESSRKAWKESFRQKISR